MRHNLILFLFIIYKLLSQWLQKKCYKPVTNERSHQNGHVPSSLSQNMFLQTQCQSQKLFC